MALLKTEAGRKLVEQITLKNVKSGFGHDLSGMYCDFYLKGKKMGYLNDDGWGGEVDITYVNEAVKQNFEAFLIANNVAKIMFENGWEFMKSADRIDVHTQAETIINCAFNMIDIKKFLKKFEKACLNGILVGTDRHYRTIVSFKLPLKEMVAQYGDEAKNLIQTKYNIAKLSCKVREGEKVLNTNLKALGIEL